MATDRLRKALAHLWTSLRRWRSPIAVNGLHEKDRGAWSDARARFWTEFREGQREAEAHGSRPR
jgi:hypothetical protein